MTPDFFCRINSHIVLDGRVPWYLSIKNFVPTKKNNVVTYPLKQTQNVIGDTTISGIFKTDLGEFHYKATGTGGFPTGDSEFGLSANTMTYLVNNHLEYSIGPFTPDIEFGQGNTSMMFHPKTTKAYTAVGPMAFFQAGTGIDLPRKLSLDLEAYENMPMGNQKIYGTVTKKGKNGKTTTTQVYLGPGIVEDNGFTAEFDIPIRQHFTLAGTYQRSLIQGVDLAGISITWKMRIPKKHATFIY